ALERLRVEHCVLAHRPKQRLDLHFSSVHREEMQLLLGDFAKVKDAILLVTWLAFAPTERKGSLDDALAFVGGPGAEVLSVRNGPQCRHSRRRSRGSLESTDRVRNSRHCLSPA